MKNLVAIIVLLAVVAAIYFFVWPALQEKYAGASVEDRVVQWLDAQKAKDEQTALCLWATGKQLLSIEEIRGWTDDYDAFRQKLGIYDGIESYSIEKVEPPYVTVQINDERMVFRVPSGGPIVVAD